MATTIEKIRIAKIGDTFDWLSERAGQKCGFPTSDAAARNAYEFAVKAGWKIEIDYVDTFTPAATITPEEASIVWEMITEGRRLNEAAGETVFNPAAMQLALNLVGRTKYKPGDKITSSGFPGVVVREYIAPENGQGSYEIRLPGGVCCVCATDIIPDFTQETGRACGRNEEPITIQQWPKFSVRSFDPKSGNYTTRIIERSECVAMLKACNKETEKRAEQSVENLESGSIVGMEPLGSNQYFTRYTLEDSIKNAAPALYNAVTKFLNFGKAGGDTAWNSTTAQPFFYEMMVAAGAADGTTP